MTRFGGRLSQALRLPRTEVALAAALASAQVVAAVCTDDAWPTRVLGVLLGAALVIVAGAGHRPLLVPAVALGLIVSATWLQPDLDAGPAFLVVALCSYGMAVRLSRSRLAVGVVLALTAVLLAQAAAPRAGYSRTSSFVFGAAVLVLLPLFVGRLVRARAALVQRLAVASLRLQELRGSGVATAVDEERRRLAEQVEPITLRGLAGLRAHASVSGLESVVALEEQARSTLAEMRELLSAMRRPVDAVPTVPELRSRVATLLSTAAAGELDADPGERSREDVGGFAVPRHHLPSAREVDLALAGLAAVLVVGSAVVAAGHASSGPIWVAATLAALASLSVAWARHAPAAAAAMSGAALVALSAVTRPVDPLSGFAVTALLLVLPFAAGVRLSAARAGICLGAIGLAITLTVLLDPRASFGGSQAIPALFVATAAWGAGRALREQQRLVHSLADAATALDDERRAAAARAVTAERTRLACDLHDAVAHLLTIVALQATAARRVWRADPERAREHAGTLRTTVREALDELRPVLGAILLQDDPSPRQPGLEGLPSLVRRARAAGLAVEVDPADPSALSAAVDAAVAPTALHLVREALTNAARYAPGARVRLSMCVRDQVLHIEVRNGPPTAGRRPSTDLGSGHGLRGLHRRVAEVSGWLHTRASTDGGFVVEAEVPLSSRVPAGPHPAEPGTGRQQLVLPPAQAR